ncbi:hypothetical protein [Rhizohabitans arisaemae]|uniref:hypothetical protein n=1 Tax=Rhizohabitans arisaemae TaxID=2720610 RepID=UPI0024B11537|nr:hypothetical protein [Rhizohabitans arisaemae]
MESVAGDGSMRTGRGGGRPFSPGSGYGPRGRNGFREPVTLQPDPRGGIQPSQRPAMGISQVDRLFSLRSGYGPRGRNGFREPVTLK